MNCVPIILEKLQLRDIEPLVDEYAIIWQDSAGTEYSIQLKNMACNGADIAWLQTSENDEYLLVVYQNDDRFSWEPKTYNSYFGCDCLLIEWLNDHLVFIYSEKHDTYICSVTEGEINTLKFYGSELARQGDMILFFDRDADPEYIKRIGIPNLEEIEPIIRLEAEKQGLLPQLIISTDQLKG